MSEIPSPDEIVDFILEELCVSDSDGVSIDDLWTISSQKIEQLDEFNKKLVWSWLIKEGEFIIAVEQEKAGKGKKQQVVYKELDKSLCKNYANLLKKYEGKTLKVKANEDKQSIHLLGVKKENNNVGQYPYQLLKAIAKRRGKGITSVDLIKETGQDRRSLTSRLQTLEKLGAVKKIPIVSNSTHTYILVHTKYSQDFTLATKKPAAQILKEMMVELKKAPNGIRIASDLTSQLELNARSDKNRFRRVARILVNIGCIQGMAVEHSETHRKFFALKFVKDVPREMNSTAELLKLLDQAETNEDDGEDYALEAVGTDNAVTDDKVPLFNKIFPLQNQLYDLVKQKPNITNKESNQALTGELSSKPWSHFTQDFVSDQANPNVRNHIIRILHYSGKQRYFCNMTQIDYLKKQGDTATFTSGVTRIQPVKGTTKQCLVDFSADASAYYKTDRFTAVIFPDNTYRFHWKTYSGKVLSKFKMGPIFKGYSLDADNSPVASNGEYPAKRFGRPKKDKPKNVDVVEGETNDSVANETNNQPVVDVQEYVTKDQPKEIKIEEAPIIEKQEKLVDGGPNFRRQVILNYVNEKKCIFYHLELCKKISTLLKADYQVDRRTVKKDCELLKSQGLLEIRDAFGRPVVCSLQHPPSHDDIQAALDDATYKYGPSTATHTRVLTVSVDEDTPRFQVSDKHFYIKPQTKLRDTRILLNRKSVSVDRRLKAAEAKESLDEDARVAMKTERDSFIGNNGEAKAKKKRRSRKRGGEDPDDLLSSIMESRKRKQHVSKSKSSPALVSAPNTKKTRTNLRLANKDVLLLVRAIIISRSLSTGQVIDWIGISKIFGGKYSSVILKRQWPRHRRIIGIRGIEQSRKVWERILLKVIESGEIVEEDLIYPDIPKLLEIWKRVDSESFETTSDVFLYKDYDENFKYQHFATYSKPKGLDLFKEALTIIEKEEQFAVIPFTYPVIEEEFVATPTELQKAKSKLKALFATDSKLFSSERAKALFNSTSNDIYAKALSELEDEKAIAYLGDQSSVKFALTDKAMFLVDWKFDEWFFKSGSIFRETLGSISLNNKGMVLSPLSPDGCFVPLINLLAYGQLKVTRVDQAVPLLEENYSTKSQDKKKLESDFIISTMQAKSEFDLGSIPPPMGGACSRLWIDLDGGFNKALWMKTVSKLLFIIVFRPGVTFKLLSLRLAPLFEVFEVKLILDWLITKNSIKGGPYGGYIAQPNWSLTFDA